MSNYSDYLWKKIEFVYKAIDELVLARMETDRDNKIVKDVINRLLKNWKELRESNDILRGEV